MGLSARVGLGVMACLFMVACIRQPEAKPEFAGTDITGAAFESGFVLTDHNGKTRRLVDFRGKVVALFFGYTHCPDVCPTTMDELAKAVRLLGDRRSEVQVLFVTLDPERDTPQVLAKYVPSFDPGFLGLYGDAGTIAATARAFKVFYKKQDSGGKGGYTIDHTAGIYVFDKRGQPRVFLGYGQKPKDIAHDLSLLL